MASFLRHSIGGGFNGETPDSYLRQREEIQGTGSLFSPYD